MAAPTTSVADEVIRALNFSPAAPRDASGRPTPALGVRVLPPPMPPPPPPPLLQSPADVLRVYVRVRPTPPEEEHCVHIVSETELLFSRPAPQTGVTPDGAGERYGFTRAFGPRTANDELFRETTEPLVRGLFQRRDALLFAYGVTNAGKTYTIQGSRDDAGVVPRALALVFDALDEVSTRRATQSERSLEACRLDTLGVEVDLRDECRVVLSYLEVYNENVYDLLADQLSGLHVQRAALKTKEDGTGRTFVPGLKEIQVSSHEEARAVVQYGAQQRQVAQTRLNSDSSRSHAILTVQLCRASGAVSRLCVVDLAGAERTARTQTGGARLKEASKINASLLTLGRCMEVLRANAAARARGAPARPVPFRDSKITRLLHDYFVAGEGTMSMIVAVHPGIADADETAHTLRFSAVAREVHAMEARAPAPGRTGAARRPTTAPAAATAEGGEGDEDELEPDAFADERAADHDELHAQLRTMRRRLVATEQRCLAMEAEIRDEVAAEMSARLAEMEQVYRERLDGAGAEERHLEKLGLYKAHSARKAERDATASHLQLVERVKEYERALVAADERRAAEREGEHARHVAELTAQQRAHELQLAEVERVHAAELRAARADVSARGAELGAQRRAADERCAAELGEQQRAYELQLAELTRAHATELQRARADVRPARAHAEEAGLHAGLEAALRQAADARDDAARARLDADALRARVAERERMAGIELAEKEAQLASNMRLEVESLEFQLRTDGAERARLLARVAELEGRLRELVAVAQHNMLHGVHDGREPAGHGRAARAAPRADAPDLSGAVRAEGRTLIVGARAALPSHAELISHAGGAKALRYDQCSLECGPSAVGTGAAEGWAPAAYSGELRRTPTATGVRMVLAGVGAESPEPDPPKRKLSGAAAAPGDAQGAREGDSPDAGEPKRTRSGELAANSVRSPDVRRPLLDAPQPSAGDADAVGGGGGGGGDDDGGGGSERAAQAAGGSGRAREIAARVAAREQEAVAKHKPAARLLGMPFARGKPPPPPEPTPVAGRTRTRAARK